MASSLKLVCAALISCFFSTHAAAQATPLACQVEESAGLAWEAGRWKVSRFQDKKFVLVLEGKNLRAESVGKAIDGPTASCLVVFKDRVSCSDGLGGHMYFDPRTLRGTIAQLLGGTVDTTDRRDSLLVSPFVCQRF